MPTFEVSTPDGKKYQLTAPDATSAADAWKRYQSNIPTGDVASTGSLTSDAPASRVAAPVPGFVPGQPITPEMQAAFRANWGKTNSGVMPPEAAPIEDVMPAPLRAFSTHAVESVPVLGALAAKTVSPAMRQVFDKADASAPIAAGAGDVFGSVAPFVVGAEIPGIAGILGMDAAAVPSLLGRTALSAGSMGTIAGADALTRGETPQQAAVSAGFGAVGGAIAPPVGAVVGRAAEGIGNFAKGVFNPTSAADDVMSRAAAADLKAGNAMTPLDEANAALNGQPVINADRFGTNVKSLARAAANVDPTARQTLNDVVQDRFLTQNQRAKDFLTRVSGGNTDALAAASNVQAAGRAANKPAYLAAYKDPAAQAIMTPEIGQLLGSPNVRKAVAAAVTSGAEDSALHGFPPVKNPFRFNAEGGFSLVRQPDGSAALPNLPFWDQVQRNLGERAMALGRMGKTTSAGRAWEARTQLNTILDNAVPAFRQARQGAAQAFGAEDALEAGQKFVGMPSSQIPAAVQAHGNFSPAEKKLFATGFVSNLIGKVEQVGDRTNVINNIFASPQARTQITTALKPLTQDTANQLEHFLRVEDIMQNTKQAVQGGSSTVAQAAAVAALGGYGTGAVEGGVNPLNWKPNTWRDAAGVGGLLGAGRVGMAKLGVNIDQRVMQSVAQALSSHDPAQIQQVIKNAARSSQTANAIKAIQMGVQASVQAGTQAVVPPMATSMMRPQALN